MARALYLTLFPFLCPPATNAPILNRSRVEGMEKKRQLRSLAASGEEGRETGKERLVMIDSANCSKPTNAIFWKLLRDGNVMQSIKLASGRNPPSD
ncbi:hypothetical protein BUALT_Bualt07G0101600 [Buddleja alternifolia]|uniref:Uncharacterized protein n=1 Tax=Buddleja alternifolia TaxID=168488 RepID=A0AAV6X9J6_9LAMI|nr:hypothetical protein BUALT_Bualt07G0101600 [Buddleja alternifolia]